MEIELCVELGIPVRDMDLMDVFLTAGRIIQDGTVRQKYPKCGSSKQVIQDMPDVERRALLERVYHRKS
jgi:hypothetical protein